VELGEGRNTLVRVDLLAYMETLCPYSASTVWPFIVRWNDWVDARDYVEHRVGGNQGAEGEVKRITHFESGGRVESSFLVRVLRVIPNRLLVYKILSPAIQYDAESGQTTALPLTGYEVFELREAGQGTALSFQVLAETKRRGISVAEAQELGRVYRENAEQAWNERYFPALHALLNRGAK